MITTKLLIFFDEVINFYNNFKAMCNNGDCQKCPLNNSFESCDDVMENELERVIKTVQKWSEENA